MIDYDFCTKHKLSAIHLIIWLGLDDGFINGFTTSKGIFDRHMQILSEYEIRISCPLSEFDKWSNSEEMYFDLNISSQRRKFVNWVKEQGE